MKNILYLFRWKITIIMIIEYLIKEDFHQEQMEHAKKGKYDNIDELARRMANLVLKKKVSFKNNTKVHTIPKEVENVEARKSIKNITLLTQANRNELYGNKIATRNERKLRRRLTKQYLKEIAKKEKVKVDEDGLKAIYDYTEGDLRHAINLMQATASLGGISEENVKASAGLTKTKDVDEIYTNCSKLFWNTGGWCIFSN